MQCFMRRSFSFFRCRTDGTEETPEGSVEGISVEGGSEAVNRRRPWKDADTFRRERRRHHSSLPVVDVEPAVLRQCQSPLRSGPPSKSSGPSFSPVNGTLVDSTTLSPVFGSSSKDFDLVQVGPAGSTHTISSVSSSSSVAKRPDSAPDLSDVLSSRPRIIIRLTSVDGLELNLTSPLQENLLQPCEDEPAVPVRLIRCGAARPQQQTAPLIPCKSGSLSSLYP